MIQTVTIHISDFWLGVIVGVFGTIGVILLLALSLRNRV